jgi:hypothetical protein
MQKEFDKVIEDQNEEISRLKDHNKKLLNKSRRLRLQNNIVKD